MLKKELATHRLSFMSHFIESAHIAALDERDFSPSTLHTGFLLSRKQSSNDMKQSLFPGIDIKMCAGDVRQTQFEAW